MRILVVGAGALGGLVGARLSEAGEDVVLIEANPARARLLNEAGLYLSEGSQGESHIPVRVATAVDEGLGPVDLVFIAVKSHQTEAAVSAALPVIGPETWVLSMQNGIGNADTIARTVSPRRILCGITYHSIQHVGPNRLRYRQGIRPIQIAPFRGGVPLDLQALGACFRGAGLNTVIVESIDVAVWQKLLHNAVVNPVSALTGLTCREMLDDDDLQQFMRALCAEIVAVMQAREIPVVNPEDPYEPILDSLRALGKNRPSMWQDLSRGFRTEVDAINGAIVREAERLGLAAPINWGMVRFVHSREREFLQRMERAHKVLETATHPAEPVRPMPRAPWGGMPSGRIPLESAPKLKEMIRDYYRDLAAADRDPDRPVAWCSGLGPVEVLRALGMTPYFPENHAALIGASRLAPNYIRRAVAEGFSPFVSTESTSDIGASLAGESPLVTVHGIDGPPRPDVVVYNTNWGQSLNRWFEYHGNRFGVPVLGLHPPALLHELESIDVDAAVQQILRLTGKLEAIGGRSLDFDRLAEVVGYSRKAAGLWRRVLDLACHVPSPLTYFDALIHLAPMLLMRGTPQAVEYYEILLAELQDRVAAGVAAVPGERYRFYWEGPPIWCALRPLARLFLENQVAVVASTYATTFALTGLDPGNPVESMARAYTGVFPNRSRDFKADFLATDFERFGVDAVVFHDGRTCPEHSTVRNGLHIRLQRTTGLPALVLEADTHDVRLFSQEKLERTLGDFMHNADRTAGGRTASKASPVGGRE